MSPRERAPRETILTRRGAKAKIQSLIGALLQNRAHHAPASYDEAKLPIEYLAPFFDPLGWDVHDARHLIGGDCGAVVEDRTRVRGRRRRPDC